MQSSTSRRPCTALRRYPTSPRNGGKEWFHSLVRWSFCPACYFRYIPLLNIDRWFQQVKFQFFSSGSGLWVIYWRTSPRPPLAGPGCSKRFVPASLWPPLNPIEPRGHDLSLGTATLGLDRQEIFYESGFVSHGFRPWYHSFAHPTSFDMRGRTKP